MYYTPSTGRAGDVIPFYHDGVYHVFYLKTFEDGTPGTEWYHVSTTDFAHWTEHPPALTRGLPGEQDSSVATGSILEHDGLFYAFYTGFAEERKQQGFPDQGVMRATSSDLNHWTKDHAFGAILADASQYQRDDWRDPFVFWNDERSEYWMLLSARREGRVADRHAGGLVLLTSPDLDDWELQEPLWEPGLFQMYECPDVFQWGEWWYLIYSTFSERQVTRYRMARSLSGPWIAPDEDALDDDGLYAAKSASDGTDRYLVGWVPSRDVPLDSGRWRWGGSLAGYQMHQREDGTLGLSLPQAVLDEAAGGAVQSQGVTFELPHSFRHVPLGQMASQGSLELSLNFERHTREFGVTLWGDGLGEQGYRVRLVADGGTRLHPDDRAQWRARLLIDSNAREAFDRPLHSCPVVIPTGEPVSLRVVWSEGIVGVSFNDDVVLTGRLYNAGVRDQLGVYAIEGALTVHPA